ncbi:MAG: sulfurtransferase [Halioglobus sp.]|nr:sulfurtransferase [Halioglobus sp.]
MQYLAEAGDLGRGELVVVDCRFSLADPEAGRAAYAGGHIPGAYYLHLEQDLSGPVALHGGRHPLPHPAEFAARLAAIGIDRETAVVAYDDARFAFAARLWWLMDSLGYRPPLLLNGGYQAWLDAGGEVSTQIPAARPCDVPAVGSFRGACDIAGLRDAQARGALVVDSREEARYRGVEEPIDPVAGHIPGAINRAWQGVTNDAGACRDREGLRAHWGDALDAPELVVYCGSGVTACVNLFTLRLLGRDDAILYAGSWSDWCSHLD